MVQPRSTRRGTRASPPAGCRLGAGSALAAALWACAEPPPPSGPGNLVLIVVDTLRSDAVIDAGGDVVVPGLARLAADGVVFPRAFSHSPMTLPSHAALFSSTLPHVSGVMANGDEIPGDLPLLAAWLSEHGYATAASVSIFSLRQWSGRPRLARGFDEHRQGTWWTIGSADDSVKAALEALDALQGSEPFHLFLHLADPHDPYRSHGDPERTASIALDGVRVTELSTSMAVPWEVELDLPAGPHELRLTSKEFMLVRFAEVRHGVKELALDIQGEEAVTTPGQSQLGEPARDLSIGFEVPRGAPKRPTTIHLWVADTLGPDERIPRYRREVEFADAHVEALLEELRRRGLYDDSVIVFTSDHGEGLGEHDHWVHARNLYDELLHVPLVIKPRRGDPRLADLEEAADELVRLVDLTPTMLELLDLPPLPGQSGVSLLRPAERILVAETHPPFADEPLFCMRDGRFKLVYRAGADEFELYDLVEDPDELTDLGARAAELVPGWVSELRATAARAAGKEAPSPLLDEIRAELEALGYTGD